VIVKKVPTSKAAPVKSKAANVGALLDYIADPDTGGDEKVEHRGALNLLNLDHQGQVQEVIDLAEAARRSSQPVQHWIMSWRPGEQPTVTQVDEAVATFLTEMGLQEHQAIYALHRNTDNCHVHLAVNRVHPETEKVVTVNNGFDHEIAHRAIARIELMQGWERELNGLYEPGPDGATKRARGRHAEDRQPSTQARDLEERSGQRSAERVAIEESAPIIERARSWRELHEALGAQGVRFQRKGSGAILWIGDQPVKASTAGRYCSMPALEKRLGEFEPAASLQVKTPVRLRPVERVSEPVDSYLQARKKHFEDRSVARERTAEKQRTETRQLDESHTLERAEILAGRWKGRGDLLNALRSTLAAQQAQQKAELRQRHQLERAALRRELGRFPSYDGWLKETSPVLQDAWRHRDRRRASIEPSTFQQPTARNIGAREVVLDGARVHHPHTGSTSTKFTSSGFPTEEKQESLTRRPESMHADVYRRLRNQAERRSRGQPIHESRLDAEVAVRMRLGGHSRTAIVEALRTGARHARPRETRNWETYAKRATAFAFSRAGALLAEELGGRMGMVMRLRSLDDDDEFPPHGPVTLVR
jgi:hypothetical protein